MGFIKSVEEIQAFRSKTAEFYEAEMLMVLWETKPEMIAGLLPWPLKPAEYPLAIAFVANYPGPISMWSMKKAAFCCRRFITGKKGVTAFLCL